MAQFAKKTVLIGGLVALVWLAGSSSLYADTISTSFEFSRSGTFSIGQSPISAEFSGGAAQTVGVRAYYHSGAFSWHVPRDGMGVVSFETPAQELDFWFRDTAGAASSTYRVVNTAGNVIAQGNGSQSFNRVSVTLPSSDPLIATVEFLNSGGGDTVVDDFSFTASLDSMDPDTRIVLALEEPPEAAVLSGIGNLRGFAASPDGIERVELLINGQASGDIPYGGSRRDVGNRFPDLPDSDDSGFSMAFNYNLLTVGENTITVRAISSIDSYRERSSTFTVTKFHREFFGGSIAADLSATQLATDGNDIAVQGMVIDGETYDVKLRWSTATQGFQIVEIR